LEENLERYGGLEFFPKDSQREVEMAKFPPMRETFERLMRRNDPPMWIPSQQELYEAIEPLVDSSLDRKAIRCRVYRAHPSFVREWHLAELLYWNGFDDVETGPELDYAGVDVAVRIKDGRWVGIVSRANTTSSQRWVTVKEHRRIARREKPPFTLDLIVVPDHTKTCGPFWLHSLDDVKHSIDEADNAARSRS
jgi:hypothetical protein